MEMIICCCLEFETTVKLVGDVLCGNYNMYNTFENQGSNKGHLPLFGGVIPSSGVSEMNSPLLK